MLSRPYRELDEPELVYRGTLATRIQEGYVLARRNLNQTDLRIGRIEGVRWDTEIFEKYLGREVEILGKLSQFRPEQGKERFLLPGRIRPFSGRERA